MILPNFSQKKHEIEAILSRKGKSTSGQAPLDPPLDATFCCKQMIFFTFQMVISVSGVHFIYEAIIRYENEPLSSTTLTAT